MASPRCTYSFSAAVRVLMSYLQPFLFATKQMSTSDRALVQDVIPYMDVLTHHIDRFKTDESLVPAVRAAAQRGRCMLDKYYTLTDETIIYRIAMSTSSTFALGVVLLTVVYSPPPSIQDPVLPRRGLARRMDPDRRRPPRRGVAGVLQAGGTRAAPGCRYDNLNQQRQGQGKRCEAPAAICIRLIAHCLISASSSSGTLAGRRSAQAAAKMVHSSSFL